MAWALTRRRLWATPLLFDEDILRQRAIGCNEQIRFITEAEYVHSSSDAYAQQFDELRTRLGMDGDYAEGREAGDWGLGARE